MNVQSIREKRSMFKKEDTVLKILIFILHNEDWFRNNITELEINEEVSDKLLEIVRNREA